MEEEKNIGVTLTASDYFIFVYQYFILFINNLFCVNISFTRTKNKGNINKLLFSTIWFPFY